MTVTDELLAKNEVYRTSFDKGSLPLPPAKKVAVLACMDGRLDPAKALGLEEGDTHVIRNAGGVASEDAIRSLVISQRLLGTEEIILIHHTDCGMETFTDDEVKGDLRRYWAPSELCPRGLREGGRRREADRRAHCNQPVRPPEAGSWLCVRSRDGCPA